MRCGARVQGDLRAAGVLDGDRERGRLGGRGAGCRCHRRRSRCWGRRRGRGDRSGGRRRRGRWGRSGRRGRLVIVAGAGDDGERRQQRERDEQRQQPPAMDLGTGGSWRTSQHSGGRASPCAPWCEGAGSGRCRMLSGVAAAAACRRLSSQGLDMAQAGHLARRRGPEAIPRAGRLTVAGQRRTCTRTSPNTAPRPHASMSYHRVEATGAGFLK